MPKDTESLGNNKAPACESRGFVRKIMKVCILTHLHATIEDKLGTKMRKHMLKRENMVLKTAYFPSI
jgi:hypothetical protein